MRGQSWNWEGLSVTLQTLLFNRQWLLPRRIVRDIRDLDFGHLKKEGFIAVAFDKDNTLSAPYASKIHPPFAVRVISIL